jgi:hypothetical protein
MGIAHFLIEEQGIEIMRHLFEQVGERGKLNNEFVELLFQILKYLMTKKDYHLLIVSKIIEQIVFNIKIWSTADYSVQVKYLDRVETFN